MGKICQYAIEYLCGNGDFGSDEVKQLCSEADIIVTNPPFSLFREFIDWLVEGRKDFLIIGNMNAISYKNVFPLILDNKVWLGATLNSGGASFVVPKFIIDAGYKNSSYDEKTRLVKFGNCCWFTTLEHGRHHQFLKLKTMTENLRDNPRLKEKYAYLTYENYDAIEVPFTNAIPSDYNGIIGVPISFLTKYNPEQFEIIGIGGATLGLEIGIKPYKPEHRKYRKEVQKCATVDGDLYMVIDGKVRLSYQRILIKHKTK